MLTWTTAMTTGVDDLDAQHKLLFRKFNELESMLSSNEWYEAESILDFLNFYADLHFEEEEREMEKHRCPVAEKNKAAHNQFRKKFETFHQEWNYGRPTRELAQSVHDELGKWLIEHVMEIDSHLRFEA